MRTTQYKFYGPAPFAHQRQIFHDTAELPFYGLIWEQGVGKTKPVIDSFTYLYMSKKIDSVLVVAPNGVHQNWVTDEIPLHMPRDVKAACVAWDSKRAGTKRHEIAINALLNFKGLRILTMNYEAMMTERGITAIGRLFKGHNVMLIFDESHYLKTPGAKRTKRALALAKKAKYRRILTGTVIANSPFDAYSQFKCLDDGFWRPYGFEVFATFRAHFGLFETGYNGQQGREFKHCVGYRRVTQLHDIIKTVSSRITKDDANLDLPPKLYQRRFFELTTEQERVYNEIRDAAIALLQSGETVTAPLAITRLLRLQQVTCGYVPTDDGAPPVAEFSPNPRLLLLKELCDSLSHSTIIWARFRRDIDLIMEMLGGRAVRYDGETSGDERIEARHRFRAKDVQFFVGNPAAGGTGINLTAAHTVIYASNSFKLTDRLQSEDRPHRIGQTHPVLYIDLIALGTVDEHIVSALRSKRDIANEITGDKLKEWI